MITVADARTALLANPLPVLFLDTCALLDIIRAPLRDLTATVHASLDLRDLVDAEKVHLFVQDIVPQEWLDNLPAARRDGENGVRAFTATWQIAADLGQPAPLLPVLSPGNLIDELEQLSQTLLNAAGVLGRDQAGMSWAMDRVAAREKPSSKAGTVKDCHILGHALQLSRELQDAGYGKSRILVSPNRSDFAAPNATVFHQDILPHANAAGLGYAVSLEAAIADRRSNGKI